MKNLNEYLNESVFESVDSMTAEKIVYDILVKHAKINRVSVDEDTLRDIANAVINVFDDEDILRRANKSTFDSYLEKDDYRTIFNAVETATTAGDLDEDYCDLVYEIFGK